MTDLHEHVDADTDVRQAAGDLRRAVGASLHRHRPHRKPPRERGSRRVPLAAAAGAAVVGVAWVGSVALTPNPTAEQATAPYTSVIGGVRVPNDVIDGLRRNAPKPTVEATGATRAVDSVVLQAVSDVLDFWAVTPLPNGAGVLTPPTGYVAYGSKATTPTATCGGAPITEPVMAYCVPDRTVVWDHDMLVPTLAHDHGDVIIAVAMAHEFGHVAQGLAGVGGQGVDTVVSEQQADCYAGAYTAWLAGGNSERFTLSGKGVDDVMRGVVAFTDHPGRPGDHGNGLERVTAWQKGWLHGVGTCAGITEQDVSKQREGLPGSWDTTTEQRTEGNAEFTPLLVDALAHQVGVLTGVPVTVKGTPCLTAFTDQALIDVVGATLCPEGDVSVSLKGLTERAANPVPGVRGDGTALVPLLNALVQPWMQANGKADDDTVRMCAVGAVTRSLTNPDNDIVLSAGDLGEVATGVIDVPPFGDGFGAVQSFNDGLHGDGIASCLA